MGSSRYSRRLRASSLLSTAAVPGACTARRLSEAPRRTRYGSVLASSMAGPGAVLRASVSPVRSGGVSASSSGVSGTSGTTASSESASSDVVALSAGTGSGSAWDATASRLRASIVACFARPSSKLWRSSATTTPPVSTNTITTRTTLVAARRRRIGRRRLTCPPGDTPSRARSRYASRRRRRSWCAGSGYRRRRH